MKRHFKQLSYLYLVLLSHTIQHKYTINIVTQYIIHNKLIHKPLIMKFNVVIIFLGDVVLRNLKLKETCLDSLDLPVRTIYGHLGKF